MVSNYIANNSKLTINKVLIEKMIGGNAKTIEEYNEEVILSSEHRATEIVFAVAPHVFKIGINIFTIEPDDDRYVSAF